jgi:hypothetical protein
MSDAPEPSDTPPVVSTGAVDESTLLPVERDRRFIVRLVLLLLVGLVAGAFVAMQLRGAAGSCGAKLIRPGSTVIPPGPR